MPNAAHTIIASDSAEVHVGDKNHYRVNNYQTPNRCLSDLRITDPRDDKTRIEDTKGGLLRDSYHWILDHEDFQRWRYGPQSQLLWIKGDPGKGKTMLLCGIIDELEKEPGNILSYFFCQATEARLSSATAVLRGLIYLLVDRQPSLISHVRKKYDHAGKQLFDDGNAWEALSKILVAMLDDPSLDGVVLIVDALDECIVNRQQLLDFITKPSRVKCIVSSRNWPEIEGKLDNAEQKVRLHLELNKDSISKAVDIYIGYKVDQLTRDKKYDQKIKDAVKSHLTANADGTFLWVALVCQELADPKVRRGHTRAKLSCFPPGLDSLYDRMMEQICDSNDTKLCKEILALASVVYRPITLEELKVLVESLEEDDYGDLPKIIGSCGSFLTLREGFVYFVHQSAKDYLLNKASHQILPFSSTYQHQTIFSRSLGAMSDILRRDIYSLGTPGFSIDKVLPPDPDPLASIRYSCVYWVDHFEDWKLQAKISDNGLQYGGVIHDFIKKKYLHWLEALSLLRSMSEGVLAVQKLESLARGMKSQELTELLRDARRFILTHSRVVEFAPLQVYTSALVFSPTRSLIRKVFKDEEPDWIVLKPHMESDWNACLQTLESHGGSVMSVVFSRMASSSPRCQTMERLRYGM
ncbi:NACHT domain-containing protein [Dactylonectria macrodidyma]|uniref:NACHT domain-containing protein n=1 Tax=Dactylonectria macrodidyma TaxID=307937 RepID=A0A9P9I870_9HYPO|nr:NACHT domain-containing protein [Dactylonectria macrodidyma]